MIGTYYRLSLADEDVGADKAESNSIQGQRGLIEGYIMARPELAAGLPPTAIMTRTMVIPAHPQVALRFSG